MKLLICSYLNYAFILIKGGAEMTVIFKNKTSFETAQFNGVTSISYNATTKIYTVNYSGGYASYDGNNYYMFVLMA